MGGMAAPTKTVNEIRVMVVGDSISHGHEGDWTWRYRIWQWFKQQRIAVRFVGPYKGTVPPDEYRPPRPPPLVSEPPDPAPPLRTNGGYACGVEPEFLANSDHFAANGRQAYQAKDLIAEQVAAYQPEFCLVELGFNDLGWRRCGPIETLASIKQLIDQARSTKPDIKFAVANIPHRTCLPGREDLPRDTDLYNDMLARAIPYWSSPRSPIALVRFCENYSCGGTNSEAAYDGLHPNALGEYQIAQAFSRALKSVFNFGHSELAIPRNIPRRHVPTPANLEAVSAPSGIVITWDAVYGAFGYDLQHRRAGSTNWDLTHVECNRFDVRQLRKGQVVECRIRTSGGDSLKSPWSSIASAVADPATAPPPINIATHATSNGFTIAWDPPPSPFVGEIDRYGVVLFDGDQPGVFPSIVGVRGDQAEFKGLTVGHRYYITMETWTTVGGGIPAAARAVRVGRGIPAAPTHVSVLALDAHSVEISWPGAPDAAGYDLWLQRAKSSRDLQKTQAPKLGPPLIPIPCEDAFTEDGARLLKAVLSDIDPPVWDWEFAISAYNGNDSSPLSEWVSPAPDELSVAEGDAIHVEIRYK
ncbi:carbohydrate esterase [Achaetomium macrosporum]|uniref:Carbohydrate esterase n=1 Tax=Achaetomium macrosporum TaxID=79813 RepID=A0AAN7H7I7_9PEZI|nr:carbohydrate esterase [Achaetomium macrosporum]